MLVYLLFLMLCLLTQKFECNILLTKDQGHVLLDMSTYWGKGVVFVHLCQKSISPHFSMFQFKE